jgi:uncharacterized protein YecE (DUF72 family)
MAGSRKLSAIAPVYVGAAGWSLASDIQAKFPKRGTHLTRYAARFPAVEINSSFYKPHQQATYAKWAASVPAAFRFSVKLPKTITHAQRLVGAAGMIDTFLGEVSGLGDKLGCLLVQLPPSLEFEARVAARFFAVLRKRYGGAVVLEARHASWFTANAQQLLIRHCIGGVAADPAPVPAAAAPTGWPGLVYYRLHGSPRMYYSAYEEDRLKAIAGQLASRTNAGAEVWCIFDNTAAGAALPDAFKVLRCLRPPLPARPRST